MVSFGAQSRKSLAQRHNISPEPGLQSIVRPGTLKYVASSECSSCYFGIFGAEFQIPAITDQNLPTLLGYTHISVGSSVSSGASLGLSESSLAFELNACKSVIPAAAGGRCPNVN